MYRVILIYSYCETTITRISANLPTGIRFAMHNGWVRNNKGFLQNLSGTSYATETLSFASHEFFKFICRATQEGSCLPVRLDHVEDVERRLGLPTTRCCRHFSGMRNPLTIQTVSVQRSTWNQGVDISKINFPLGQLQN